MVGDEDSSCGLLFLMLCNDVVGYQDFRGPCYCHLKDEDFSILRFTHSCDNNKMTRITKLREIGKSEFSLTSSMKHM